MNHFDHSIGADNDLIFNGKYPRVKTIGQTSFGTSVPSEFVVYEP